jgi:hypothetical protein
MLTTMLRLALAMAVGFSALGSGTAAVAKPCKDCMEDCSGRHISCRSRNPVRKFDCERRKALWKGQCELRKAACFKTCW